MLNRRAGGDRAAWDENQMQDYVTGAGRVIRLRSVPTKATGTELRVLHWFEMLKAKMVGAKSRQLSRHRAGVQIVRSGVVRPGPAKCCGSEHR